MSEDATLDWPLIGVKLPLPDREELGRPTTPMLLLGVTIGLREEPLFDDAEFTPFGRLVSVVTGELVIGPVGPLKGAELGKDDCMPPLPSKLDWLEDAGTDKPLSVLVITGLEVMLPMTVLVVLIGIVKMVLTSAGLDAACAPGAGAVPVTEVRISHVVPM